MDIGRDDRKDDDTLKQINSRPYVWLFGSLPSDVSQFRVGDRLSLHRQEREVAASPSSRIGGFLSSPFQINQWLRLKGLHYGG